MSANGDVLCGAPCVGFLPRSDRIRCKAENIALTRWGVARPATLTLFAVSSFVFLIGIIFDLRWQIGWSCLAIALLFELYQSVGDLVARRYLFDAPLFCIGMLVFTTIDPIFSLVQGTGFPDVYDRFYSGEWVGNYTGFVISVFCTSFFAGRLFVRANCGIVTRRSNFASPVKVTNAIVLIVATAISVLALLLAAEKPTIEGVMYAITARSRGYVAFVSGGLGTQNPLLTLFAQCIPTAIILWMVSMKRKRVVWNCIAALVAGGFFVFDILAGGRSELASVFVTLFIYWIVQSNKALRVDSLLVIFVLFSAILSFQSNFRDKGIISEGFFQYSPFRGFALNREVAFIVDTYGRDGRAQTVSPVLEGIALPLPETAILFLVNPVPRTLWTSKPVDSSFGQFNMARTGETGFEATSNVTPTIPGRFFMKYGFWGVIEIGLLYGFLWRSFDARLCAGQLMVPEKTLVSSMLNSTMFISLRDFMPGRFYPVLFLLAFIWLSEMLEQKSCGRMTPFRRLLASDVGRVRDERSLGVEVL